MLWKNSTVCPISDATTSAHASSLFIADNTVYVVGYVTLDQLNSCSKLWSIGTDINVDNLDLNSGGYSNKVNSVFVEGDYVYVVGGMDLDAQLWRTGKDFSSANLKIINLTNGDNSFKHTSEAYSIIVTEDYIYMTGNEKNGDQQYIAKLWKIGKDLNKENGFIALDLGDGTTFTIGNSVFVAGDNVYIAGNEGRTAKLWKINMGCDDVESIELPDNNGWAKSVFVENNYVYVGATYSDYSQLWKISTDLKILDIFVAGGNLYAAGARNDKIGFIPNSIWWKNNSEPVFLSIIDNQNRALAAMLDPDSVLK